MSNLKYRIWNPKEKHWSDGWVLQNGSIDHDTINYHELQTFTVQQYVKDDIDGHPIYEGDLVYLVLNTPEYDKKNIFEIVKHRGSFAVKPRKLTPPPHGGNYMFSWITTIIGHNEEGEPIYDYTLPPPRSVDQFNIIKVIGNIFETPELIEE